MTNYTGCGVGMFSRRFGNVRQLLLAILAFMPGCSSDRIDVRTELLPFEPKAHLIVAPISLSSEFPLTKTTVTDGPIEDERAFYCDFAVTEKPPGDGETIVVEISASPADDVTNRVLLWHILTLRSKSHAVSYKNIVQPLRTPGKWQAIITVQEGPSWQLGPQRRIGEFTFDVVASETSEPS